MATASTFGLVVVANPQSSDVQGRSPSFSFVSGFFNEIVHMPFLPVIQLSDIVDRKGGECIPRRTIPVPAAPYLLALSCDHSMLAVCYASNNSSFITIYSVPSFLSNVRISKYFSSFRITFNIFELF